jgi:hypothetical protein
LRASHRNEETQPKRASQKYEETHSNEASQGPEETHGTKANRGQVNDLVPDLSNVTFNANDWRDRRLRRSLALQRIATASKRSGTIALPD